MADTLKPFTGELDAAPAGLQPFTGRLDGEKSGPIRRLADTGLALAKGVVGVPEAAVGVADLVTGGQAGKMVESAGVRFKDAKQVLTDWQSPEQQAADAAVQQADGFMPTLGAMVANPSTIINAVAESAPSMLGGGVAARGAMKVLPRLNPIAAGAVGEGVVAAGQNAEQVRQEDPNGTLTGTQAAILGASGLGTGAISLLSGRLANKMGLGDVNTMLASGKLGPVGEVAAPRKGVLRRIAEGATVEGALQELPQSMQEQAAQNLAQDKPLGEGVGAAGAQGLLAGGVTGGIAGPLGGSKPAAPSGPMSRAASMITPALPAPVVTVGPDGVAQTTEQRQAQRTPQVRGNIVETEAGRAPEQQYEAPRLPAPSITVDAAGEAKTADQRMASRHTAGDVSDVTPRMVEKKELVAQAPQANDAPKSIAAGAGAFASEEDARTYISSQKRAGGASIQALPMPQPDGTFGIAIKGSPDYPMAEFHQKQQALRAAGVLDGDVLSKSGDIFKHRLPAQGAARKAGADHQVVPVQGGFVVRAKAPEAQNGPTTDVRGVDAAAAGSGLPDAGAGVTAGARPDGKPAPAVGAGDAGAQPADSAVPRGAGNTDAVKAGDGAPEEIYQRALAKIQDEYEADPNAQRRDAAKNKAKKAFDAATKSQPKQPLAQSTPAQAAIKKVAPNDEQNAPSGAETKAQAAPAEAAKAAGNPALGETPAGPKAGAGGVEADGVAQPVNAQNAQVDAEKGLPDPQKAVSDPQNSDIDTAAQAAATSPTNDLPEPTEAQKEAGNYKKGHVTVHGLDISVENPKGSTRSGTGPGGATWSHTMSDHYGYIKRTTGADKEQVDVYVGPKPDSAKVFVVDQLDQKTGKFDEHKVMLGYGNQMQAAKAYRSNFDKGWKVGPIKAMSIDEFKTWLKDGDTTKPAADEAKAKPGAVDRKEIDAPREGDTGLGTKAGIDPDVDENAPQWAMQYDVVTKGAPDLKGWREMGPGLDGSTVYEAGGLRRVILGDYTVTELAQKPKESRVAEFLTNAERKDVPPLPEPPSISAEIPEIKAPAQTVRAQAATKSIAKPPAVAAPAGEKPAVKIEDFGEEIRGAKKMIYAEAYADSFKKAKDLSLTEHPLSKTWPEPDYQKLLEGGADPWAVAFAHAVRDQVPNKPQLGWKLKGWVEDVKLLRGLTENIVGDPTVLSRAKDLLVDPKYRILADRFSNNVELYLAVGHENSLKGIRLERHRFTMRGGQSYNPPKVMWTVEKKPMASSFGNWPRELVTADTKEEAVEKFKARVAELTQQEAKTKSTTFEIYAKRGATGARYYIGKKIGPNVAELKAGFEDVKAARTYLAENTAELQDLLAKFKDVPDTRGKDNAPRVGADHRKNGDVSPEQFQEAFGFRGVQFGNYVEGSRRQRDLNDAYDAFMDLAGILNVPPRALSLNGQLGLAFGARGSGGKDAAAAHFEPGEAVINLTKTQGAGSLAHEWWHSLDNYFSRKDGKPSGFMTENAQPGAGVREEMRAAFNKVKQQINLTGMLERSKQLDKRRAKVYWTTGAEMSARAFESYIIAKLHDQNASNDYLANVVNEVIYALEGAYPYPTAGELPQIREGFDSFFQTVETSADDAGKVALQAAPDAEVFARTFGAARGMSVADAQAVVDRIAAKWKDGPRVVVVQSVSDLPTDVQARVGRKARGVYTRDAVYIIAGNNLSADSVARTLAHEAVAHHGLRGLLGQQGHTELMRRIHNGAKTDKLLQASRDYVRNAYKDAKLTPKQEADEIAAHVVEMAVDPATGEFKPGYGWLKMVFAKIKAFLRSRGFDLDFTTAELHGILVASMKNLEVGQRTEGGGELVVAAARDGEPLQAAPVDQTETTAFKKWFGDSKVIDAAGKPLVVYHGTASKKAIKKFDGLESVGWFSEGAKLANMYAAQEGRPAVYPVHLSIKKPLVIENFTMGADAEPAVKLAEKLGISDDFGIDFAWANNAYEVVNSADFMAGIKALGYDGIKVKEMGDWTWAPVKPEQIKSAIGNNGDFDGDTADILMALGDPGGAPGLADTLKNVTVTDLKRTAGNKLADYRGLGLQFLGGRQLNDIYAKDIPQLPEYTRMVQQMSADANEVGANADQVASSWGKLPDERELAELMHDATLAQIDAAKPFVAGDNRMVWGKLNADFKALSPEAQKVYLQARDGYEEHYAQVREAIRDKIERSDMAKPAKAALLERMDGEFFEKIKGVYFPLSRFGKYVVVTRNSAGDVVNVSRAETLNEADTLRTQMLKDFPAAKGFAVGKVIKDKEFNAARDSVGRGFLKDLFGVLDEKGVGEELQDAVNQLYLASMPDLSWAKHGIHRKGTPGFSQDARRAYAQNMFHGARYLAKLRYADQLQDKLVDMQKFVQEQAGNEAYDSVRGQQVVDEITKRNDSLMNPKSNPLSTALTSFGFVYHLGLSPASAMVNLSQTALVAYPIMGAKWGFDKAAAALATAGKQAATNKNDISAALDGDELRAYHAAVDAGTIDVTNAHDLAGIAQGEDAKVSWKLRPIMKWASFLFHHAERFNRQITFVASYRLARGAGASHDTAFEQATKATYDGHFDYASSNRPRVMQGNAAKVLLLFKQFGQNMVYTIARQAQLAMKAETPEGRREARKALGGLLAMHAAAAGALGLPMVTTLLAAASMLGSTGDEPWDAEAALRNMLADVFGQKPAEVMSRGLSRLTPWDISGRVGLDKLILPDLQEGLEGQRLAESAMAAALGPVAGIGINALKGAQEIAGGHWDRGLESMMPAALRGPVKALRYAEEGAKDKSGIVIKDEVSAAGVAGQALGLSPSEVRSATEGRGAIFELDKRLSARRKELMDSYAQAAMKQDAVGAAEARAEILQFNEKNPGRRILPLQLAQSVRNRQKRIAEAKEGVYLPKNRRDAMAAGQFSVQE